MTKRIESLAKNVIKINLDVINNLGEADVVPFARVCMSYEFKEIPHEKKTNEEAFKQEILEEVKSFKNKVLETMGKRKTWSRDEIINVMNNIFEGIFGDKNGNR